jgi:hypothetical protein
LFLCACGGHKDLTSVKRGMSGKEVVSILGEPTKKQSVMMGISWWRYSDNTMVIMGSDTVVRVVPDVKASMDSMEKVLKKFDKAMDSLSTKE